MPAQCELSALEFVMLFPFAPLLIECVLDFQAGLSGIHLTARITQFGPGIDFQVYDRNALVLSRVQQHSLMQLRLQRYWRDLVCRRQSKSICLILVV